MTNPKVDRVGNKRWYNSTGQYHRLDGPAVELVDGGKAWYQNGKTHRLDGPAVECIMVIVLIVLMVSY